jgi:hypothetical protein
MGAGDGVAGGLEQMGYEVTELSDEDVRTTDLSVYDAVVAGVRAFNTRPVLHSSAGRLRSYMENGGTFVVQYVTTSRGESEDIGPYPLEIGRNRITDETATLRILQPGHRVFRSPNPITEEDFQGWVQERGLYFARSWDGRYTSLLAGQDPGEAETEGSLLVANVGKGVFVYTGLSFFRQILAGVPGAYRLLANIVSLTQ